MNSTGKRGRPPHGDILTPAEWRVVEGIRHGMAGPDIARRLKISPDAVKYHVANILQKLGMSRRAELRRWSGVRGDSALKNREENMDEALTLGPIGQISRHVADIDAARHWYGAVLGLPLLFSVGNMAFFDCGGIRLMLSSEHGANPGDSIIYFRADDIRQAQRVLEGRGIVFTHAPHRIAVHDDGTEEWMGFFNDNEGRSLAIISQVKPTA